MIPWLAGLAAVVVVAGVWRSVRMAEVEARYNIEGVTLDRAKMFLEENGFAVLTVEKFRELVGIAFDESDETCEQWLRDNGFGGPDESPPLH